MSGFELHPEAYIDIDEIAAYIGQESAEAAHRVTNQLYGAIQKPYYVPASWPPAQGFDQPPDEIYPGSRFSDCIRTGGEADLGRCGHAWAAQPSGNGRDFAGAGRSIGAAGSFHDGWDGPLARSLSRIYWLISGA